jgi:phosphoribosylglycinamide formyltransferase 1
VFALFTRHQQSDNRSRRRTAVLISGRGTNLQALIEAAAAAEFPAEIALVLSSRADAAGLERARAAGVAAEVLEPRPFASREAYDQALSGRLQAHGIELVCLAGFMRILGAAFVAAWHDRALNIHPSLLPAFPGLDTHRRALDAGVRVHGCTVHLVRAEVDAGPIVVQAALAVRPDDTPDTLAARVLPLEHRCYPLALSLLARGRLRVEGERVLIEGATAPEGLLINPGPGQGEGP